MAIVTSWRKLVVSTHVPARGGHYLMILFLYFLYLFQHTCPHEAGTKGDPIQCYIAVVSTHVPARGGHLLLSLDLFYPVCFNTRARTRRAHPRP